MVDIGSGCLQKLAGCGMSFTNIEGVILSHFHVDHTSELPLLLFASNYSPGFTRSAPLTIMGPRGLRTFMEHMERLYPWVRPKHYEIEMVEGTAPEMTILDGLRVTSCQAEHGDGNALSVRLDGTSGSVTFSGDTGYSRELIRLGRDTDILFIECSFAGGGELEVKGHLTPHLAARIASECNARKVVLTHLYPEAIQSDPVARFLEVAQMDVTVAHDLLRFTL